jgi:hypothetical protein
MARLTYYLNEKEVHGKNGAIELSNTEAKYVFKKLKTHYKFNHVLEFWGNNGGGRCSRWTVRVSNNPTMKTIVHEVAHAIQMKKRGIIASPKREKWHTKKHMKIMARIYKYAMPKLDVWRAMAKKKNEMHFDSIRKREENKKEFESLKNTNEFKLQQLDKRIRKWESKRKRAENALKRLNKRKLRLLPMPIT